MNTLAKPSNIKIFCLYSCYNCFVKLRTKMIEFDQNIFKIALYENSMKIQISPKFKILLQNAWDRSMMQSWISFGSCETQNHHNIRSSQTIRRFLRKFSIFSVFKLFNRAFLGLFATNVAGICRLLNYLSWLSYSHRTSLKLSLSLSPSLFEHFWVILKHFKQNQFFWFFFAFLRKMLKNDIFSKKCWNFKFR